MDLHEIEQQAIRREANRTVFWYPLPTKMATALGIRKVGLIALTAREELQASARAGEGKESVGAELAKESLRYADDRKILVGDGSADEFWAQNSSAFAQLRTLIVTAYAKIHHPTPEDMSYFLDNQTTTLG